MPARLSPLLAIAMLLTGCATGQLFANRLACTADGQRAVVASMYGPIGVASFVAAGDAQALCQAKAPAPQPQPVKTAAP